jgi:hypothetical protein
MPPSPNFLLPNFWEQR